MPARPLPPQLRRVPFSVPRADELGVPRGRLRALDLSAPFHGVRATVPPATHAERCAAFAARMPVTQVFSHATAALLWGVPLPSALERGPLHVSALRGREPRVPGVVGHRLRADRVRVGAVRGLPVVSACDSWCQLATALSHDDLVAAGDRLLGWPRPLVSADELDAAIERHRGGRGTSARDAARLDLRPGAASPRETRLRLQVIRAGFPEPELNAPIPLSAGWTAHGDLVFRAYGVLLEYDGEQHRGDDAQFHRDVERLNDLAADGWIVIRVGRRLPMQRALDQLERAMRSRGWRGVRAS
ncbi:hypothetical protein [Agromyces sp. NDB4Y10]|uniref:hypothetical protein n=1 Tax=Agromyces sp. NDB4Y10 TaxID=1775951 RepID=UPI0008322DF0|nr:hypothetical protein [Agromyces sp. NDB4Y10]